MEATIAVAAPTSFVTRDSARRADRLVAAFDRGDFPLDFLCRYPVSAIETMAGEQGGRFRGACVVSCLGCCANALRPRDTGAPVVMLSTGTFKAFLELAKELAERGFDILSTGRLNMFSASNELDHPDAIALRRMLSEFVQGRFHVPLGHLSSDIVFHVSRSNAFRNNLRAVIQEGMLWDNVCIAIDEQVPFANERSYFEYLDTLDEVWQILAPALRREIPHAKRERLGEPRVVVNMLVPGAGSAFRAEHTKLFKGGPYRAVTHEELIQRYLTPFVGGLRELAPARPVGHIYTTGVACLDQVPDSMVFVAAGFYAQSGRSDVLLNFPNRQRARRASTVRTKLVPISGDTVQIRAICATAMEAEDEWVLDEAVTPKWFKALDGFELRLA